MTDNELIAEFMDYYKKDYPYGKPDWVSYNLSYDASWDWLMPVVIKINSFYDNSRPFKPGLPEETKLSIEENVIKIKSMIWSTSDPSVGNWIKLSKRFKVEKGKEIEAAYKAVVEFIKWYNNEKQL